MQVGKVVGSIVSTQKHESLKGMKLTWSLHQQCNLYGGS